MEELKKQLEKAISQKSKGIDTTKYSGVIKTEIDPLEYQKKIRDEWE
jgi:hypothetical protein